MVATRDGYENWQSASFVVPFAFDSTGVIDSSGSGVDWNNVTLRLTYNGADASTTFTDLSNDGHTVTANGDAQVSGNQLLLDGSGDYLSIPDASGLELGGDDFGIEDFVTFNSLPTSGNSMAFCGKWGSSNGTRSYIIGIYNNGGTYQFKFAYTTDGTTGVDENNDLPVTPSTGVKYHYAVTRDGSDIRFFWDGALVATLTLGSSIADVSEGFTIGAINSGAWDNLDGKLDDFRFVKGEAPYTAAFTAPTPPLPTS